MKEITHDLNHDLTFYCRHYQLCVPQYKVNVRVLGIYNFEQMSNPLDSRKTKLLKTKTAEFSIKTNGLSQIVLKQD